MCGRLGGQSYWKLDVYRSWLRFGMFSRAGVLCFYVGGLTSFFLLVLLFTPFLGFFLCEPEWNLPRGWRIL